MNAILLPPTQKKQRDPMRERTKKHSFMGVLSCVLAGFGAMLALIVVPVKTASGMAMWIVMVVLVATIVGMCAVGIGLSVLGLITKRRRKALAACGLIANPIVVGLLMMYLLWPTARTLVGAANENNISVVQNALRLGVDIDARARIRQGDKVITRTALTAASERGWLDVVAALIAQGADLHQTDGDDRTALYRAAVSGHLDIVKLLVAEGADPNGGGIPPTPLSQAARAGYLTVVKLLAERGADINAEGSPPLVRAAEGGHTQTLEYLHKRGADINSTDKNGNTPLHLAAANGHYYAVNRLLRFKANPDLTNAHDETPLELAVQRGRHDIVRLLVEAGTGIDAFTTIGLGNIEALENVLAKNPDAVNVVKRGRTPLHVACELGNIDAVKLLIKAGAQVNPERENDSVRTPLHEAIKYNQVEAVDLLLKNDADPNATFDDGSTIAPPIYFAVIAGQLETVKALLERGGEINAHCITPGIDGPPLYFAVHYGKDDIARLLVEKHADVNARKNTNSPTALFEAIMRANVEMVKLLVNHGAKVNDKVQNKSPLSLAQDRQPQSPFNYSQIIFLLEHRGAKGR